MRPDRCGTGRDPSSLPDGDRQAVEQFIAFLSGELAYNRVTNEYVDLSQADGLRIVAAGQGLPELPGEAAR